MAKNWWEPAPLAQAANRAADGGSNWWDKIPTNEEPPPTRGFKGWAQDAAAQGVKGAMGGVAAGYHGMQQGRWTVRGLG